MAMDKPKLTLVEVGQLIVRRGLGQMLDVVREIRQDNGMWLLTVRFEDLNRKSWSVLFEADEEGDKVANRLAVKITGYISSGTAEIGFGGPSGADGQYSRLFVVFVTGAVGPAPAPEPQVVVSDTSGQVPH